jgi:PAS domain-containing protein
METHTRGTDFPDVFCDPGGERLCKLPVSLGGGRSLDDLDIWRRGHLLHRFRLFTLDEEGIRPGVLALRRLRGRRRIDVVAGNWLRGSDGTVYELTKGSDGLQRARSDIV